MTIPLPDVTDPVTAPFWAAAREHRFVLQRCRTCRYIRWPASPRCPECLTPGGVWTEVPLTGIVWSHVVYHRPFHPAFEDRVPYSVAIVQLDAGPRYVATVEGAVTVGSAVTITFADISPEVSLPVFVISPPDDD